MITKFNKYDKVNESLPRQSTVDQLHRIRDEIKKSQVVKVGPEETTMGGDIGDRVMADLKKHQMNNLFWWDNPTDRHIDSYETFVKDDSRDSLGYTSKGDPKTHKGTDYVKENKKSDIDPWGEEDWTEEKDPNIEGYFVVDRWRNFITINYAKEFLKKEKPRMFETFIEARDYLRSGFYDDSDYDVFVLYKDGEIKRKGR